MVSLVLKILKTFVSNFDYLFSEYFLFIMNEHIFAISICKEIFQFDCQILASKTNKLKYIISLHHYCFDKLGWLTIDPF